MRWLVIAMGVAIAALVAWIRHQEDLLDRTRCAWCGWAGPLVTDPDAAHVARGHLSQCDLAPYGRPVLEIVAWQARDG